MNSLTEDILWKIYFKIQHKTDSTRAQMILEPLKYYIVTGRCDGSFIRKFNHISARQISTIANRLIKFNGDYAAINSIVEYIG